MAGCVFCRIISGEIPAAKLLDTDALVSFLNVNPVNPGHALVVPKRHVASALDLSEQELCAAVTAAARVAAAVCSATNSTSFNILQNNGRAAGQVVEHVHLHVIPRKPDDGFAFGWRQLSYREGELSALQHAIRQKL